jgi:enoyl-CoA hydratase/carnithine racemase
MSDQWLDCQIKDKVAFVAINRPPVNALDANANAELGRLLEQLDKNPDSVAVVLTGTGKAFCAGADIKALRGLPLEGRLAFLPSGNILCNKIEALNIPVVCAINGFALGGGLELAMACDIRVASDNATLGLVEIDLGNIAGSGGTQRLPRLVGKGRAKLMLLTAARISAAEAYRIGLVEMVVPADNLLTEAGRIARTIAQKAPLAVAAAKRCVNDGLEVTLQMGLKIESEYSAKLAMSEDVAEGERAFFEKRPPIFKGR